MGVLDLLFGVITLTTVRSVGSLTSFSSATFSGDCGVDWDVSAELASAGEMC